MTREIKIGMAVAGSFLSLVGIVVGSKLYNGEIPEPPINGIHAGEKPSGQDSVPQKKPGAEGEPGVLLTSGLQAQPLSQPSFPTASPAPNNNSSTLLPPPHDPTGFGSPPIDLPPILGADNDRAALLNAKIDQQNNDAKKPNNGLPPIPEVNALTIPPVDVVAQNRIIDPSVKKQGPTTQLPPLSPPTTVPPGSPPAAPDASKLLINGGPSSAPPTNVPDLKSKQDFGPPPVTFGKESPLPSPNGVPPIPKEMLSPFGVNPPPPTTQLPPLNDPTRSAIQTPQSPIVAPKPVESPMPPPTFNSQPGSPNNVNPLPQVPPGNPFAPANPNPPPVSFGNAPPPPATNLPTAPGFNQSPGNAPPSNNIPQPPDSFPALPVPGFNPLPAPVPPTSTGPLVKFDTVNQYICRGIETYDQIAAREYVGARFNLGPALEEYNRVMSGATQAVRLQLGTRVLVPSQELLFKDYARFVPGGIQSIPPAVPVPNNGPIGAQIGLSQPAPGNKLPATPTSNSAVGVRTYRVTDDNVYLSKVAEQQLGNPLRWIDIYRLNPELQPEQPLRKGMELRVPAK